MNGMEKITARMKEDAARSLSELNAQTEQELRRIREESAARAEKERETAGGRAHLAAQVFVQGRKGFVQQQHPRLCCQRAGQRDPLLLPAGELIDPPPAVSAHLHLLQESLCLLEPLGFADALHF